MRTLGQIFRHAREAKGLSASQAAEGTRIKPQTLDWMEADQWGRMPAPLYARGFIKIYAEWLELEPAPLIEAYTRWTKSPRQGPPAVGSSGEVAPAAPAPVPAVEPVRPVEPPPRPVRSVERLAPKAPEPAARPSPPPAKPPLRRRVLRAKRPARRPTSGRPF